MTLNKTVSPRNVPGYNRGGVAIDQPPTFDLDWRQLYTVFDSRNIKNAYVT